MMPFTYEYPRAALTVDALVFSMDIKHILLVQRSMPPFKDQWALPGGFVGMDETLEEAVSRELEEETGLRRVELNQFHAFSAIDRDPRHRTISVVFYALIDHTLTQVHGGDDASDARWFNMNDLPVLAFDHDEIIALAAKELK